jgi:two-component system CheB/CheR fusion protein
VKNPLKRKRTTPRKSTARTQKLTSVSRKLAAKAERLHQRADALHNSIDVVHRKGKALHQLAHESHKKVEELEAIPAANAAASEPEMEHPFETEPVLTLGRPFPVVGIGASAGGFEALNQLLAHLPRDTGMGFVVVQHLDPAHESKLTELLAHASALPVVEFKHGTKVEADHVYVMRQNATVTIAAGQLKLGPRQPAERPPMPVDQFFRSLAQDQQNQAIGIVLSGTGSDGTLGLQAIKGEGGMTFAQDEASAKYFGMPGSAIAAGAVDFVLPPQKIAEELGRIARHPYVRPPAKGAAKSDAEIIEREQKRRESSGELSKLFALLRGRTGVDFSLYKHTTLKRRIVRRMLLHKKESLADYIGFIHENTAEVDALFNDLLINVTSFFRDPETFQALKTQVFPKLIKAHHSDSPLRIWVCGCSTGEEAYSLAMSLIEFFEKNRAHRPVQIFSTDISEHGIEKARAGVYPESIVQDVSPERLRRFFTKAHGHYQVNKAVRDMCVFARQNLILDPPFSNLDLVSCRNVLIYFNPILQRRIIPIFHYALRPNRFLMLGTSETVGTATDLFEPMNKKHKIYTKKPVFHRTSIDIPHKSARGRKAREEPGVQEAIVAELKVPELQQHVDKILLRDFSPAAVVVNARMEVLHFRGRTGNYLEHSPGAASLNLLKMARDALVIDLRSAINKAARKDEPVQQTGVRLRAEGHVREITLEVIPFRVNGSERFFLVLFRETGVRVSPESLRHARSSSGGKADRRELARLQHELDVTKESLQATIKEQEATNEELKSANEEIQSNNEELQSTNEELETAKEELQSTNEELTTLNEELQNRNIELSQVNNDLNNLLSSVNIAILMLGNDLTIRRFTPMAERVFNLIPSDVGRRLSDMTRTVVVPDLDQMVRQVIDELTTIEREVQDREGRWYSLRVRPYRTRENKIDGAVIMLVDIDDLKRALDVVLATVKVPMLTLGPDLKVLKANESFCRLFQIAPEDAENRLIYKIRDDGWDDPKLHTLLEDVLPVHRHVEDFAIETDFGPQGGKRTLLVNARRFYEEGRGMQMILLAFEEASGKAP